MLCLLLIIAVWVGLYIWRWFIVRNKKPLVHVVVLGDVGHSPRMQYHALSLAETGLVRVQMIGFRGSTPISALMHHPDVSICYITSVVIPPSWRVPFVIYALIRLAFESAQLLYRLLANPSVLVLVQTPPAVPSMAIVAVVRVLTGARVIFDFHNITYMHLASKVKKPWLVGLVRLYERLFARIAWGSLCVTHSMKRFLESEFGLSNVHVLYDRPGPQFQGRTVAGDRDILDKELLKIGTLKRSFSKYTYVVVSSTSWTPDEDFSILLKILPELEIFLQTRKETLLLFITGKGECKAAFEQGVHSLSLKQIDLATAWLPAKDYPLVLGLADCGISLHTSTSGLDLPMKAVDMLGAECPVLALQFPALVELLGKGGGLTFGSPAEFLHNLEKVLVDLPLRKSMAAFAAEWRVRSWTTEWAHVVRPLVERVVTK